MKNQDKADVQHADVQQEEKVKIEKVIENYRSRTFGLLLYPDDPTHVKALEEVKSYEYAYINHDKDIDEEGKLKKAHWHVVLTSKNAIWAIALSKSLGIKPNYIQKIRNFDSSLEYLLHLNEGEEKALYNIEEVKGPLKKRLIMIMNKGDKLEGEKVIELLDHIQSQGSKIRITNFARDCAKMGYWDVFRRSAMIYMKVIEEHNFDLEANKWQNKEEQKNEVQN